MIVNCCHVNNILCRIHVHDYVYNLPQHSFAIEVSNTLSVTIIKANMIDWLIMSTGRDYVFELWSPTGLLLTPQVIHEDVEPR
jgi:hypothetical protein